MIVPGRVEVPGADPRWATADLGEPQPLRSEEPLHVRRARADPERLHHRLAHLTQLLVVADRLDAVGGDELRGDPAGAHGLEHVGVVVAHEVGRSGTIDRQRVVEPFVSLDELLHRDRVDTLGAEGLQHLAELGLVVHARGVRCPCTAARLEDEREPHSTCELLDLLGVVGRGRRGCRHPRCAQCVLHRRLVAAEVRRAQGRPRDGAGLAHLSDGQDVRLDGGLKSVDPGTILDPPHRVSHRTDVDHAGHLMVMPHPTPQLVVERPLGGLTDPDHLGTDRGQRPHELTLVPGKGRFHEDHSHASTC